MNVAHLYIDCGIVDVLTERTLVQIDGMDVYQVFLKLVGLIVSLVCSSYSRTRSQATGSGETGAPPAALLSGTAE
ncbi:hypothetical protein DPMN_177286 [Dreissena polymorpha]|uniref:Uncharacterized protein n=1 Tax=Dreissena polymorpha TaxID=45954 RepID=A0A9D4E9Y8_DREPO|nr:hypothetical protein DPMN_177286 [Dreissena polymorpha]